MSDYLQQALRDRDYATVMEILPDLIESGEGAVFTVDSLAAAVFATDDPNFRFATRDNCERFAAAIIEAAKEAERE